METSNKTNIAKKRKVWTVALSATTISSIVLAMVLIPMYGVPRNPISNVAFVPNTNNLNDKSFNQETIYGVEAYENNFNENVSTYTPTSAFPSNTEFYSLYTSAITSGGAEVVLGNSYTQAGPINGYCETSDPTFWGGKEDCEEKGWIWKSGLAELYPNVTFILLDDLGAANNTNGISITFKSNEAGFMAGIAASIYATYQTVTNPTKYPVPIVSTWGGGQYATVYDWMSGFEQGVNWFNYAVLGFQVGDNAPTTTITSLEQLGDSNTATNSRTYSLMLKDDLGLTSEVQMTSGNGSQGTGITYSSSSYSSSTYYELTTQATASGWFTGTFVQDSGSDVLAKSIENAGASVVFPVAGGQYYSALTQTNMSVIGVDTDAALSNPDYAYRFVGSATKNLNEAAELGLWMADRYQNDFGYTLNFASSEAILPTPEQLTTTNTNPSVGWTVHDTEQYNKMTTSTTKTFVDSEGVEQGGWYDEQSYSYSDTTQTGLKGMHLEGTVANGGAGFVQSPAFTTPQNGVSSSPWEWFTTELIDAGVTSSIAIDDSVEFWNYFISIAVGANSFIDAGITTAFIEYTSPTFTENIDGVEGNSQAVYQGVFPWSIPMLVA